MAPDEVDWHRSTGPPMETMRARRANMIDPTTIAPLGHIDSRRAFALISLAPHPPRPFHYEHILRMYAQQFVEIPPKLELTRWNRREPALLPDQEER